MHEESEPSRVRAGLSLDLMSASLGLEEGVEVALSTDRLVTSSDQPLRPEIFMVLWLHSRVPVHVPNNVRREQFWPCYSSLSPTKFHPESREYFAQRGAAGNSYNHWLGERFWMGEKRCEVGWVRSSRIPELCPWVDSKLWKISK